MKSLSKMMVGAIALCMGVFASYTASAKDLYWNPVQIGGNTRSFSANNVWLNGFGETARFESGDNVHFDFLNTPTNDEEAEAENDLIKVGTTINVGNGCVVGDMIVYVNDYWGLRFHRWETTLTMVGSIAEVGNFQKYGAGILQWHGMMKNTFTNDLHIYEGTLYINPGEFVRTETYDFPTDSSMLGSLDYPHTIYVGDGDPTKKATLEFYSHNSKYMWCWEHQSPENLLFVLNAGTYTTGKYATRPVLARVIMKNGSTLNGPNANNYVARLCLNGDIDVVRGERLVASNLVPGGGLRQCFLSSAGKTIVFNVDEVTSEEPNGNGGWVDDDVTDLYLKATISDSTKAKWFTGEEYVKDSYYDAISNSVWTTKSPWIKRGKGTLEISTDSQSSSYTGDIDIEEGTVRVTVGNGSGRGYFSPLGNPYVEGRRITILEGAKLDIAKIFAWEDPTAVVSDKMTTFVISNGLLSAVCGSQYQLEVLGSGDFYYSRNRNDSQRYAFAFGPKNIFKTDTPRVWPSTDAGQVYLDCFNNYTFETYLDNNNIECTNHYGQTEFNVSRVKDRRDPETDLVQEADLILGMTLGDRPDADIGPNGARSKNKFRCGILKTGDGVLAVQGNGNYFMYPSIVAEGGLIIDGLFRSNVTVRAGATIGGSGRIGGLSDKVTYESDLIIEEGGGMIVDAREPSRQLTVNGTVTIPTKGHLLIQNYTGDITKLDIGGIAFPGVTATGARNGIEDINVETWTALVDGYSAKESRHILITKDSETTLRATYKTGGFRVIVR